ncbi:GNAT family N-acetyltransferase [Paenibacillus cremeus]|uniref:GNAT family N-acetyltransferase n=1 Tax=Paenibacillus cremeus TaxID=2163881 RepID=A0A559K095_9BACL|nr:GNAT family N-acetyltransferase [Paenibacillus cremeus]TVY05553.1 GNAT family N-acetyltransferase [Paenibacillus cremeus]
MLRKRIPSRDDAVIMELVEQLLVPFAKETVPDLRLDATMLRRRLDDCTTYVAMSAGGRTIGFVSLKPDRERLSVDMLAVSSKYQGLGVGARLMHQAERTAQQYGCREVTLWVDEANKQAQRFYLRNGYMPTNYDHRLRCYFMTKQIA